MKSTVHTDKVGTLAVGRRAEEMGKVCSENSSGEGGSESPKQEEITRLRKVTREKSRVARSRDLDAQRRRKGRERLV